MEYKQLGNTDVQIPEIGLGAWAYTGGVGPLRKGISLGARLIDTAEAYGTEDVVGDAIRPMRRDVFLATKVSPSNFRYADVIKAADSSLSRLETDVIDLYQLHWPNASVPIGETMSAMDRLVEDGKVRFIGVSNFSVAQLKEAQASARNRIVSNQIPYSLADRAIERDTLPFCQEKDVTVIAYSPLAKGISRLKAGLGGVLGDVAEATGKTEAQVALNWCVSKESVVAIPKSDSAGRTEENCNASGWRLSEAQISLLESRSR